MQRIPLLTPARWSLDNAAFEVLQRIESVTPNDATLLEGNDGRAEKHVAEEKRAERMRERIERRNTHADVYAGVEAERDDKGGYGENTSPTLAEENAKDWRHVHEQKSDDGDGQERHDVDYSGEEIIRADTNKIAKASMPAGEDEILSHTRSVAIARLREDISPRQVIQSHS